MTAPKPKGKPGRKPAAPTPRAPEPAMNEAALKRAEAAVTELAHLQEGALTPAQVDEVLAAGIDIGRLESLDFVIAVSTSAVLSVFENVKKSKAWRHLKNPQSAQNNHFQSLDEFCQAKLGKSYARLRALAANRNLIGQEAFEQAERMGLRQIDYDALKALPAPEQELVRRAVEEAKTRDEVIGLMQELAARHAKSAQALQRKAQDADDLAKSNGEKLEQVKQENEQLREESRRIKRSKPDVKLQELRTEVNDFALQAKALILGEVRGGLEEIAAHDAEHSTSNEEWMSGLLWELERAVREVRGRLTLKDRPDGDDTPPWLSPDFAPAGSGKAGT